jgi:hypothetical protein
MRRFKQVLAVVLGTTMVLGSSLTAFAGTDGVDQSTAGTGQVLDFKKVSQVVPTALKVAINPNGYDVNLRYKSAKGTEYDADKKYYTLTDGEYAVASSVAKDSDDKITAEVYTADVSKAQIVTFNYGLANKSTVARKITVKLDVTADESIEFVSSANAAKSKAETDGAAERGEYKVYLELVPAKAETTPTTATYEIATTYDSDTQYYSRSAAGVYSAATVDDADAFAGGTFYVPTTTIGTEIQASELGDITMQNSTTPIAFAAGTGTTYADVAYSLPESEWTLKDDEFIDFSTTAADVADKFEMTDIGGLSGFTITGTMNKNAEWSLLTTKTITITPTYAIVDATGEEEAVATGLNQVTAEARTPAAADPAIASVTKFTKASPADVVITFTKGTGTGAVDVDGAVLYQGANNTAVNTAKYTVNATAGTVTIDKSAGFMTGATADVPFKLELKDGDEVVASLTGTIEIE